MNMPLTRAEDVSDEIEARLKTILLTNGNETNIGQRVTMGRQKQPVDSDLPCIQVFEAADNTEAEPGKLALTKVRVVYVIDAFDTCDPDAPNRQAHKMLRDIKRVIFTREKKDLDGKVIKVHYLTKDIAPRGDGENSIQARIVIKVDYVEDLSNP